MIILLIFTLLFPYPPSNALFAAEDELMEGLKKTWSEVSKTMGRGENKDAENPYLLRLNGENSSTSSTFSFVPLCVDCPEILSLTRAVNGILQEYIREHPAPAASGPDLTDKPALPEQVEQLEAMSVIVGHHDSGDCQHRWLGNFALHPPAWQFHESRALLLLSADLSSGKIGAIHIVDGKTRIYLYRIRDNAGNRFIRIVVTPDGVAHLSIWEIEGTDLAGINRVKAKQTDSPVSETGIQTGHFRLITGPRIGYKDGLPNDLFLLDFAYRGNLTSNLVLSSESYFSAQEQHARASLSDGLGREYIYISYTGGKNIKAAVPYTFNLPNLEIDGELSASPEQVGHEIESKIADISLGRTVTRYRYEDQTFTVEHIMRPLEGTRLSIKYENSPFDEENTTRNNSIWIRFGGQF